MRGPIIVMPGFESRSTLVDPLFCRATTLLNVIESALALAVPALITMATASKTINLGNGGTSVNTSLYCRRHLVITLVTNREDTRSRLIRKLLIVANRHYVG